MFCSKFSWFLTLCNYCSLNGKLCYCFYVWVFFFSKKFSLSWISFYIRGDLFFMKWSVTPKAHLVFVLMDNLILSLFFKLFFMNSWCFQFCNWVEKSNLCLFKKGLFCSRKTGSKCRYTKHSFSDFSNILSQFVVFVYSYSVTYSKLIIQDCEIMDFCDNKCIDVISVCIMYIVYCITKYILY